MKVVVDTNIIFSALLNANSTIGRLLFYPQKPLRFYTCEFLLEEIEKHNEKLLKISGMSLKELDISKSKIYNKVKFIDHKLINDQHWEEAKINVSDIDPDDVSFVALAHDISHSFYGQEIKN